MTRAKIRIYVISIIAGLLAVMGLYIGARIAQAEFLSQTVRDVIPLMLGVVAVVLSDGLQRRGRFLNSLRDEWRSIVRAKSALTMYCEIGKNDIPAFLHAFHVLSEAIDSLRVVYRNVNETPDLIGYYPYEPLHDMRRYIEEIDPRRNQATPEDFRHAQIMVVEAFLALREVFLDEIDIAEPTAPLLLRDARRKKKPSPPKHAAGLIQDEARPGS
jgi:hypothetical protein